jgi:hypothetical protein
MYVSSIENKIKSLLNFDVIRIWIRIRIKVESRDPDPHHCDADPQHCFTAPESGIKSRSVSRDTLSSFFRLYINSIRYLIWYRYEMASDVVAVPEHYWDLVVPPDERTPGDFSARRRTQT